MKHDDAPDYGPDGPASLARPSRIRAIEVKHEGRAGYAHASVRECRDVLVIDRLHGRGWLTDAQHAAAEQVARVGAAAGVGPGRTVGRLGGANGAGEPAERSREAWNALIQRVPGDCHVVVHATCVADQWPLTAAWLASLKRGLDAIAAEGRRVPRQRIRTSWE